MFIIYFQLTYADICFIILFFFLIVQIQIVDVQFFLSESENAMDFQLLFPQLSQPINNNYNIISVIE